jgi:hypothetical protein
MTPKSLRIAAFLCGVVSAAFLLLQSISHNVSFFAVAVPVGLIGALLAWASISKSG